jgi:hypothetical protein
MRQIIAFALLCNSYFFAGARNPTVAALPTTAYGALTGRIAPPLWVSSRVAFDEKGDLRSDLFEPAFKAMLERNRASNRDGGCRSALGAPVIHEYRPQRDVSDLASHALAIVAGDVVRADPGFYNGTPGTLYRVAISDVVKSMGRFDRRAGIADFFVANATIVTPRGTICARDPLATAVPAVGDRVLLFSPFQPADVDGRILPVDSRSGLVVEHAGKLSLPPALRAVRSVGELVSALRENPHIQDVPQQTGAE